MLWIARQVAVAIDAIQNAGWVHGDVKPSNILVSPSGHVTLIDLGFARRIAPLSQPADTQAQPFLGTLCYCAPELMISRLRGDVRSDLYSLAVVLYEMLAGTMPFESHDPAEIVRRHREELPLDVRILSAHIPAKVARLINLMLSKDPLRRVQTASEVIDRLMALEVETFSQRSLPVD
jgi:serine/threonine-protein kinase